MPDRPVVGVVFRVHPAGREILREALGDLARLSYLEDVPEAGRAAALEEAEILLCWNLPRELAPGEYAAIRHARFLQLVSAGADHLPFASLTRGMTIAANPGA